MTLEELQAMGGDDRAQEIAAIQVKIRDLRAASKQLAREAEEHEIRAHQTRARGDDAYAEAEQLTDMIDALGDT